MPILAGADGCPAGWICITKNTASGQIESGLYPSASDLIHQIPPVEVLAIDIPIGLTSAGARECDQIARRLLGSRACCVFPAPIRPALHAGSRKQASAANIRADGRGVGCQAWNIYPKIREVDAALADHPAVRQRVIEVHPELSFRAWNGCRVIPDPKKSNAGSAARRRLIGNHFGLTCFDSVRTRYPKGKVQSDDIADAFAALWTAERFFGRNAVVIPDPPPTDSTGLAMRIVY